jgi:hypothetical protein
MFIVSYLMIGFFFFNKIHYGLSPSFPLKTFKQYKKTSEGV